MRILPLLGKVAAAYLGLCLWGTCEGHSEGSLFDGLRPTLSNSSACRLWSCAETSPAKPLQNGCSTEGQRMEETQIPGVIGR